MPEATVTAFECKIHNYLHVAPQTHTVLNFIIIIVNVYSEHWNISFVIY